MTDDDSAEQPPIAKDHDTLKYSLLGPSLTKPGQDNVDQKKVIPPFRSVLSHTNSLQGIGNNLQCLQRLQIFQSRRSPRPEPHGENRTDIDQEAAAREAGPGI